MTTLLVNGVAKGVPQIRSTDTLKSPVWENEGFELVAYTPHCSGETKWVLPTPCVTHLGVNTDRGSSGHLSMYGDIVFNHGSLITIHFPMQTCVTKGWWQVRKYWVLQRKRGMNRASLVNGCWPGLLCERYPSLTPWSVFCLEIYINFLSCYYTGRSPGISTCRGKTRVICSSRYKSVLKLRLLFVLV